MFIYVHSKRKQKKSSRVIKFTVLPFWQNVVILRVAIINVWNVRLQRQHRPTDNASTRRWRGSQQTGPVRTTRHYQHFLWVINKKMHALFCTLLPVWAVQKLLKSVKIRQSCSNVHCYVLWTKAKMSVSIFPGKVRT